MSEFYEFVSEAKKFPADLLKKIRKEIEEEFTIYKEDIGEEYAEFLPSTSMLPNKMGSN